MQKTQKTQKKTKKPKKPTGLGFFQPCLARHVHDLHVAAQLRAVVEAARAELAAEAHQLLVHHAQVFQEVAASFQRLLAEVALHRLFTAQAHVMSPANYLFAFLTYILY